MEVFGTISEKRKTLFEWEVPEFKTAIHEEAYFSPEFSILNYAFSFFIQDEEIFLYPRKISGFDLEDAVMIITTGIENKNGRRLEIDCKIVEFLDDLESSIFLFNISSYEDEILIISCRMEGSNPHCVEMGTQTSKLMDLETLSSNFDDLFNSKRKCDVIVKVRDMEFETHKTVLVARSPLFDAMFEHDLTEKETGIVTLPDCDADSFGDFLHYLYTGKFEKVSPVNAHHLYVTSDKYDVQDLKSFCAEYLKVNLTVENVLDVAHLADRYSESELMFSVHLFFNENINQILQSPGWEKLTKEKFPLANKLLMDYVHCSSLVMTSIQKITTEQVP